MTCFRDLWISAAFFSAFINFVAGTERDENSRSTMFTAFPGSQYGMFEFVFSVQLALN